MASTSKSKSTPAMVQPFLSNPLPHPCRLNHKLYPYYRTRMHYFQVATVYNDWTVGDFLKYRASIGKGPDAPTAEEVWLLELVALLWQECTFHRAGRARTTEKLLHQFVATPGNDHESVRAVDAFTPYTNGRIRI